MTRYEIHYYAPRLIARFWQAPRYEIHYETGDSWWWQATENTRAAAEQRIEELRRRFPTREWRIQEMDDEE